MQIDDKKCEEFKRLTLLRREIANTYVRSDGENESAVTIWSKVDIALDAAREGILAEICEKLGITE